MKKWVIVLIIFLISVPLVIAAPPKISLVVKPIEGDAPLTVMASEESGDATIVDWSWDFGDGNRAFKESKIEHIYEKAGEYKLICTVINEKGEESSDSVTIVVKESVIIEPTPTPEIKPDENTTIKVVWEGATPIADTFAAKAAEKSKIELDSYEKAVIQKEEMAKVLTVEKYPLDISDKLTKNTVTIQKYRCTDEICGYWITCQRDKQEVATNSPIWISPPPYEVVISESFDSVKNEQTVTLKENPKLAVSQVLQGYCDRQPLGKAIVGTKE